MDINEATKLAKEKPEKNLMVLNFGYNTSIVLSTQDAVAILNALTNAEQYEHSYSSKHVIKPFEHHTITTSVMAADLYKKIKISNLLGVSVDDLKSQVAEITELA